MGRKGRSPKYPQLPLREAIERTAKVYRAERTHKVEREAVAKDLGYGGLNGASISLISTLKEYGLLQEDKEGVRVTEDAVTILRAPEGDPDKEEALRRAAFAPRVFSELSETYGDNLNELPAETALQYRLEKKGFLERAASEVIRVYRDELELVSEEVPEYTAVDMDDQQVVEPPMRQSATDRPVSAPTYEGLVTPGIPHHGTIPMPNPQEQVAAPTTVLQFKPSEVSEARIELRGDVTQEAIDTIVQLLNIQKRGFRKEGQPEQPAIEQPVEQIVIEAPAEQPAIEMPAPE